MITRIRRGIARGLALLILLFTLGRVRVDVAGDPASGFPTEDVTSGEVAGEDWP